MKNYRSKELNYLLIIYILLFLYWCTTVFDKTSKDFNDDIYMVIKGVVVSGILPLCVFIIDSLVSSKSKDKLVGLFFLPRAGSTIFTRIASEKVSDDRIFIEDAKTLYKEIIDNIPCGKKEKRDYENKEWYYIYQKYDESGSVYQSQRDYLLCRDLFVCTITFLILYFILLVLFNELVLFSTKFIITLLTVSFLTNLSTHVKMNRFVNTVIAKDISETMK